MNWRIVIAVVVLLIVSLVVVGCKTGISQQEYDKAKADLAQAQQELGNSTATLSDTRTTLSNTQQELATIQATLSSTQSELNGLKAKCPPGDFPTVSSLESWVANHLQPVTQYADESFREALKVQDAGLQDGYLISVNLEYDTNTDLYTVGCNAIAAGNYYWWSPEQTTVYPWSAIFRR